MGSYLCNGAATVPVVGGEPDKDAEALVVLGRLPPGREVVGVPLRASPRQGGVHCVTMQVPRHG